MPELRVVAQLTTKPGSEEIIREALSRLASATQNHRGCAELELSFLGHTWHLRDRRDLGEPGRPRRPHMQTEDIAAALAAAEGHVVGDIVIHPLRPV